MSPQERHELAKEIAAEITANHIVCRMGLTPEQADQLKSLADATIKTKKIAGVTAVTLIVTAFFGFFIWAVVEKIKSLR
jgi:hypothetical protein